MVPPVAPPPVSAVEPGRVELLSGAAQVRAHRDAPGHDAGPARRRRRADRRGIAGALVGGILGMVALTKKSNVGDRCHGQRDRSSTGKDDINTARGLATASNVTLIAGGGIFLAGIITLAVSGAPSTERNQVFRIEPLVGAGSLGLSAGAGSDAAPLSRASGRARGRARGLALPASSPGSTSRATRAARTGSRTRAMASTATTRRTGGAPGARTTRARTTRSA